MAKRRSVLHTPMMRRSLDGQDFLFYRKFSCDKYKCKYVATTESALNSCNFIAFMTLTLWVLQSNLIVDDIETILDKIEKGQSLN